MLQMLKILTVLLRGVLEWHHADISRKFVDVGSKVIRDRLPRPAAGSHEDGVLLKSDLAAEHNASVLLRIECVAFRLVALMCGTQKLKDEGYALRGVLENRPRILRVD